MNQLISPLRYPGSKLELVDYLVDFLSRHLLAGRNLFELYAGGASVSLALVSRGLVPRATLVERDPLVSAFWSCVILDHEELCKRIADLKVDLETWKAFQVYLEPDAAARFTKEELGLAGLFLNRTSFSGIIGAGPIGGYGQRSEYKVDCRFNKARLISQITNVAAYADKLAVVNGDALQFLKENREEIASDGFVYIDPPYYQQGRKLYRFHYSDEQHEALAAAIRHERFPWLVSYDNHDRIRELFEGSELSVINICLNYAVKKARRAEELLISNRKLFPAVYEARTVPSSTIPSSAKAVAL